MRVRPPTSGCAWLSRVRGKGILVVESNPGSPQRAPVKAGVWRVASLRTPSHAGSPAHVWLCVAFPCPGKRASWWLSRARGRFGPFGAPRGRYAEVVRRGPARPVTASTGTQTSPDDLRLSLKSPPKPTGAVPVTSGPKPRVDAGSLASTSEQGKAPPGLGRPPRTSGPNRPDEPSRQSTLQGRPSATQEEPMDESGPRSDEEAPSSGSVFSFSAPRLASTCAFGDQLDSLLRDRFVCGINNPATQTRLLELPDPSLDDAVKAALAIKAAANDASEIARAAGSPSTEVAVNKMATRSGACSRCGAAYSPS
ncbi:hypothetical protein ISCGN_001533 [Ixodes scapularis]